jgi:hypothetical protein
MTKTESDTIKLQTRNMDGSAPGADVEVHAASSAAN